MLLSVLVRNSVDLRGALGDGPAHRLDQMVLHLDAVRVIIDLPCDRDDVWPVVCTLHGV